MSTQSALVIAAADCCTAYFRMRVAQRRAAKSKRLDDLKAAAAKLADDAAQWLTSVLFLTPELPALKAVVAQAGEGGEA